MRKFLSLAAMGFSFLLMIGSAYAAVDPAVSAVHRRYAGMRNMKVEFTQVLTHKESGGQENRTGVLFFEKPLQVRWETTSPVPELLLITPEAVWNAFPDEDMAYKYPAEISDESAALVRVITGQGDWANEFVIENKGQSKGLLKLVLYPNNPTHSMTEAELLVDAKNGDIKSVIITDFYYNKNEITFVSQTFDSDMKGLFNFTPTPGMKVEDKSKDGTLVKPLLR